ncbi:hypothetical protein BN2497_10013 [Janthinobacterium sp. CG23_2]|nr:hypothetical protein BN2497_10013 [Janthinobacterium sp. CG23_2]CUU31404.1 hypothetical protein BN3177_10013 [Janthinobacterium sp. CG23_2]
MRFFGALGCRAVVHSLKNLVDCWHDESVGVYGCAWRWLAE